MSIKNNLQIVREQIAVAAQKVGQDPHEIKLVGVIKNVHNNLVIEALENGLTDIGENKVQEAAARYEEIKSKFPHVTWHMIGHLQRNKVRQAIDIFDIIHSLDSIKLAREIGKSPKKVSVLIEVNTSGEESKYGISPEQAIEFVKEVSGLSNIKVLGLMTMAPIVDNPEKARPYFKKLKMLSSQISSLNLPQVEMKYLSMGMSDDFEVAIEEGANLVRIGRAIFDTRR